MTGRARWFVTVAYGDAAGQLRSAERFHASVRHPASCPLQRAFDVADGRFLVYSWSSVDVLNDPFVRPGRPHDAAGPTHRPLPATGRARNRAVVDTLLDAHVAVAACGFVAVDFYDGCVLYDFAARRTTVIALDCTIPYLLELDRQYGSTRFRRPGSGDPAPPSTNGPPSSRSAYGAGVPG